MCIVQCIYIIGHRDRNINVNQVLVYNDFIIYTVQSADNVMDNLT